MSMSSRFAVSEPPPQMIERTRLPIFLSRGCRSTSRLTRSGPIASIQATLPLIVEISPLCAERPERLRAAPGGRGVGAVAAVEQHEARGVVRVAQVRVELADLRQLRQALVDHGAVREARDREVGADLGAQHLVEREAQQVAAGEPAVFAQPCRPAEERLAARARCGAPPSRAAAPSPGRRPRRAPPAPRPLHAAAARLERRGRTCRAPRRAARPAGRGRGSGRAAAATGCRAAGPRRGRARRGGRTGGRGRARCRSAGARPRPDARPGTPCRRRPARRRHYAGVAGLGPLVS